jgi:ribose transport system ATP-binding protein
LAVEGLASGPEVIDVSFDVGVGEIVGLAGLVGSGRTETLQAVFGLRTIDRGQIAIDGVPTKIASPREAIRKGTVLIPEDRQAEGLFSEHSVAKNICIIAANTRKGERVTRLGGHLLDGRRVSGVARRFVGELQIKTDSIGAPVAKLSGGNQQKVILARCLAVRPTVVLADEPTRGVAIGSKIEIYRLFRKLAQTGAAIVLVSSEFEELVGLCERIVLMRAGRTVGEASAEDLDDDALLHLVLATT